MIYILTCFVKLNMTILYTPLQKTPSPAQILARELPQGSIPSRYMLHACPRLPRICESIAGTAPLEGKSGSRLLLVTRYRMSSV
jgi:hypothetical protein